MAYEYERGIIGMLRGIENRHLIDLSDHKQELKEVYRKAKAFDEILEVDNQATDEDRLTGEYESNIETIIGDYMEDK